jgi:hypothetical protein
MRLFGLVALALALPAPAWSAGLDVAQGLADVIAAEEFCGLAYDQPAIETFIADNVADDDLQFTGLLKGLIFVAKAAQETMSASAATAHCAQIRRLAAAYRFTS